MSEKAVLVSELFGPTIQGEGKLAGTVSHFVRFFGCSYRCSWCDSMHAVDPVNAHKARSMRQIDIADEVEELPTAPWVTLTGGDPVLWDLSRLVDDLYGRSFKTAVETQGYLWQDWLEACDLVTCSPKPPSSGMSEKMRLPVLQKYVARLRNKMIFKIVIFNTDDLEFAQRIHRMFKHIPMYLSNGTEQLSSNYTDEEVKLNICSSYRDLAETVANTPFLHDCIVLPQLHALAWGRELGR